MGRAELAAATLPRSLSQVTGDKAEPRQGHHRLAEPFLGDLQQRHPGSVWCGPQTCRQGILIKAPLSAIILYF